MGAGVRTSYRRRRDDGPFGVGSRARLRQPGQPEAVWEVTAFVPGERFTWRTERAGLQMTATHELRPEGEGTTNTLRVAASGWMTVLIGPLLRFLMRRALAAENAGLKARCEREADRGRPAESV